MGTTNEEMNGDDDIPDYSLDEMGIAGIRDEIKDILNPVELEMYEQWRKEFAQWTFEKGKDPYFNEGYDKSSMYNIMNRVEKFIAWRFDKYGFSISFDTTELDEYWETELKVNDNKLNSNRREINNASIIIKYQGGEYSIPKSNKVYEKINERTAHNFEDYFSNRELEAIKHAALKLYTVPEYDELDSEKVDDWTVQLSQRLGEKKEKITEESWENINSYKIPSLVYVSRDVGFRPTEIENSSMSWVRLDDDKDARIQIPRDEDSKEGKENWRCYLSMESARLLKRWKTERETQSDYDETDAIWLNREGNPYHAGNLRQLMRKLMDEANIEKSNREQGWYMIRRGVGTEIANNRGLGALMSQLRINRIETARRYVQTNQESIKKWMDTR